MKKPSLVVSECFGATIQGEGPSAGRLASFVRLGGCNLHCEWCMAPDTPVLMADWSEKAIKDVVVGDWVASFRNRRFEVARVEATMARVVDERVTVRFDDREVVCTPDHVFATPHQIDGRRRSSAGDLMGRHVRATRTCGWLPDEAVRTDEWWTGWLQGLVLGDGHVGQSEASPYPKVWLRVCDKQLADAFSAEVNRRGAKTTVREVTRRTTTGRIVYSVVCALSRVPEAVGLPDTPDGVAGFLAGFFDAEGNVGRSQVTMSQKEDKTLDRVGGMCASLGVPVTVTHTGRHVGTVTVNGVANVDKFMRLTRPVLDRKRTAHRRPDRMLSTVAVDVVKDAGPGEVVNLTTSSGFFFANGALVEQCDTQFTWNANKFDLRKELTRKSVDVILSTVAGRGEPGHRTGGHGTRLVIVTGGEPLLHQDQAGWVDMLDGFAKEGIAVEVETNGTIAPNDISVRGVRRFVASPKLAHGGDPKKRREVPEGIAGLLKAGAAFKFVVQAAADMDEVARFVRRYGIPADTVWVMPEGIDADTLLDRGRWLAPAAVERGWNFSTRLHVLVWGNDRGN